MVPRLPRTTISKILWRLGTVDSTLRVALYRLSEFSTQLPKITGQVVNETIVVVDNENHIVDGLPFMVAARNIPAAFVHVSSYSR